jgi:anti-sigma B factor antagonist
MFVLTQAAAEKADEYMINLVKEVRGNYLIIKLSGKIGGEASIELYREVKRALQDYTKENLALDFSKLEFIDSSGLGSLVAVNSTLLKQSRSLTLASVPENLLDLLKITNLDRVLKIVHTIDDIK